MPPSPAIDNMNCILVVNVCANAHHPCYIHCTCDTLNVQCCIVIRACAVQDAELLQPLP